ncbi:PREDICTED: beta-carotene isomerase D27, chloroplastic isoform X4 [Nelumbo nucifera]|uniref:Beta-carotene isomerase D27, chloroplastic isoform X4 n=1 Tax=Nelumbo nucifera TaxID=4432 RepID=A0A1U8AJV8_NELNU|nr:PREDICTED: beta-carotene isomerase D27, chloroplastic isoform X4 [Nelumbo nucifera]
MSIGFEGRATSILFSDEASGSSSSSHFLFPFTVLPAIKISPEKPWLFRFIFPNSIASGTKWCRATQEVGWDSEKPGYDGLIEVANRLMMNGRSNAETAEAAVRILRSLFPPFLLELFKMLIAPIDGGKVASMMVARVTALSCQWLMGSCTVNSVDLPDGSSCTTGVFVERCKYLEESKCIGICINTCKLPTQAFFKDYMGVPLLMEPNFSDYSCQFKFGVSPPLPTEDKTLKEPCLDICPNATRRRQILEKCETVQCPKV